VPLVDAAVTVKEAVVFPEANEDDKEYCRYNCVMLDPPLLLGLATTTVAVVATEVTEEIDGAAYATLVSDHAPLPSELTP
jgi:hypothetical protein